MLLAGYVGGTKTQLALVEPAPQRPRLLAVHSYLTNAYPSFAAILDAFAGDVKAALRVDAVAAGVAGPVVGGTARLTNIDWDVNAAHIGAHLKAPRVRLLNDLEAMALGAGALGPEELVTLQRGTPRDDGTAAVIAA